MTPDDVDTPRPAGPSWLERLARKRWARWLVVLLVLPTLALIALVLYLAHVFMEDEPVMYSKIEEHFKYASTGGERESGYQGHAFGTELSPADKDALIEYLKTL